MTTPQAGIVLRHLYGLVAAEEAAHLSDGQLLERFATRHEEAAFEALVRRHGPPVWGVCRRVAPNAQDAEDAFQATFLALARKAAAVGRRGSVAGWLYRVAYHAAVKARGRATNRMRHERQAALPAPPDPLDEVTGRELLAVLDEELHRMPSRWQTPLVL
jgi:RNA polymerase sigma factor (sigma-70 family)